MSTGRFRSKASSELLRRRWNVPALGRLHVVVPGQDLLSLVDREWTARRTDDDNAVAWVWSDIMRAARDRFALVDDEGRTMALWCGKRAEPLELPDGRFYRVDYLEVDPDRRRSSAGLFVLSLIACRALEQRADGVIFGAVPNVAAYYEKTGFTRRVTPGWSVESGLIAYEMKGGRLERFAAYADAFHEEGTPAGGVP